MDVKSKRVLVVGLGKSGVASAQFLAARGARVTVSDTRSQNELKTQIPALLDRGIQPLVFEVHLGRRKQEH